MTKVTFTNRTLSVAVLTCIAIGIGTEKSVSALEFAFEKSNNHLALYNDGGVIDSGQLMKPGTVPSFSLIGSGYEIGYQGYNGHYCVELSPGVFQDTGLYMLAGTSPSTTQLAGQLAWGAQSPDGHLWIGQTGWHSGVDTHLVMSSATSPSVAALPNGHLAWGARGLNGDFWLSVNGPYQGFDTGGAIHSGTSPSIAAFPDSETGFAIVGLDNSLWVGRYNSQGQRVIFDNIEWGLQPGTSASLIADSSGDMLLTWQSTGEGGVTNYLICSEANFGTTYCSNPFNDLCNIDLSSSPTALYIDSSFNYAIEFKGPNGNLWLEYNFGCYDQGVAMN